MSPLDLLTEYLGKVERRLRLLTWTRGAAITAAAALVATIVLVWIANRFAFSESSLLASRTALFLALALAVGFGLLIPLLRMNRRRAAGTVEKRFPQFEERLVTLAERAKQDQKDPFLELIAADALDATREAEPAQVAQSKSFLGLGSAAAIAVAVLVWLGTSGPGFWGYGTSLLWAGPPKAEMDRFYDIQVKPGDRTIRRRTDQLITARITGLVPQRVRLMVRYESATKWEEAIMQPQPGSPAFQFLIAGVPEALEYYVEAGQLRSNTFKIKVVDLPGVKKIKVTYNYPAWSGLQSTTEDPGGDLRAVEGTVADVEVTTDKPLSNGLLILDNNTRIQLVDGKAKVPINKDGMYYVATVDRGEEVRLSDDYFIEARKDNAPNVRINRPGRDARVNPIEEVPVTVVADDDFGLQELKLHYSVNGGDEKVVSLLNAKGAKATEGKTLLALENFNLSAGDIVTMYATAKDARASTQTDIFFVEAQPFDREYRQSQQSGGGGGGEQEDENSISKRQKEIIAATWNEIRDTKNLTPDGETGKFLSDVQAKLRDQAQSLANRTKARALAGQNQEFKTFVQEMEKAVAAMGPASEKLKGAQWQPALGPEQQALQHLLRAESVFRQIQVAFGQRGGGGGGGGGGRDLENLFDLELDTEKNQYESGQQASGGQNRQKEIDEALQKLEELARRQQELAEQQRRNPQSVQQRWQQEMLRREAEELQRQMEQLSQNGQQSNSQSSSSSQSGQQSSQGGQGQQSQQSRMQQMQEQLRQMRQQQQRQQSASGNNQQQLERALERLKEATKDMQNAAGQGGQSEEARRAAERLKEARDVLSSMRQQQAGDRLNDLAERSERLADKQREFAGRLMKEYGQPGPDGRPRMNPGSSRETAEQLAREKDAMRGDLEQLQREMQEAARELAGSNRDASNDVRKALGQVQQEEVARSMQWSADALRRGYGPYTVLREAGATQALDQLKQQMRAAAENAARGNKPGGEDGLERALQQAESLRQQMEQMARALSRDPNGRQQGQQGQQGQKGQQGQGQQPGNRQGQEGQQGQQGQGQQAGNQPGQQGQQGQSGQQGQQGQGQQGQGQQAGQRGQGQPGGQQNGGGRGGDGEASGGRNPNGPNDGGGWNAMNRGDRGPLDAGRVADPRAIEQSYRESIRDLTRLRESVQSQGETQMTSDIQNLIREMSRLDPSRFPGNPELVEQLRTQVLGGLENLELQLRRKVDEKNGSVRSGTGEPVPSGYARSVAEYFRKLSKQ